LNNGILSQLYTVHILGKV